jgi:hypothetical protein
MNQIVHVKVNKVHYLDGFEEIIACHSWHTVICDNQIHLKCLQQTMLMLCHQRTGEGNLQYNKVVTTKKPQTELWVSANSVVTPTN